MIQEDRNGLTDEPSARDALPLTTQLRIALEPLSSGSCKFIYVE